MLLKRQWIDLAKTVGNQIKSTRSKRQRIDSSISLLTWNTLAKQLAEGFSNVSDPTVLQWDRRKDDQIKVILENDYDIVCLQEVDTYDTHFNPVLTKHGYEGAFCLKQNELGDCICIFWKKDKFNKLHEVKFRYGDQSQVALAVIFSLKTDPTKKFCVATTHLKAGPEFERTRDVQGTLLMNLLASIKDEHKCSIIFAGDMNDHPESDVIRGFNSKYVSPYDLSNCIFTTWKSRKNVEVKRVIDYIFHDATVESISILSIPTDDQCPTMLPALYWPSDHLAIGCKFRLK